MITRENIFNVYPQFKVGELPQLLVLDYPFVSENMDLYNTGGSISEYIDTYISKLNEYLKSSNYSVVNDTLKRNDSKVDTLITSNPNVHIVSIPKSEKPKAPKKVSEKKPTTTTKKVKAKYKENQRLYWFDNDDSIKYELIKSAEYNEGSNEVEYFCTGQGGHTYKESEITTNLKEKTMFLERPAEPIEKLPIDVYYIKRYITMNGKIKTADQVLNLLHSLQKAITEKTINKKSQYSDEIMQIQNELIKCVEAVNTSAVVEIDKTRLEHYSNIVSQYQTMLSVTYLKKYISLNGKSGIKGKAEELAQLIKKAVDTHRIPKTDRYAKQLEVAYKNLIEFSDNTFVIEQAELNGLQGLDDADGLGFITPLITGVAANVIANYINKGVDTNKKIVNSTELAGMTFETLPMTGDYLKLIGTPSRNFSAMVYGMPGGGKTTWCMKFAKYLAEYHNLKALFATIEEGVNHTAQEKINRLNAVHHNLVFANHLPDNLTIYDAVFIDSINSFRLSPEDLQAIRIKYPEKIFISIFQVTKDGKFKGSQEFQHDVDIVIRAENGTISTVGCKNRFGHNGSVKLW